MIATAGAFATASPSGTVSGGCVDGPGAGEQVCTWSSPGAALWTVPDGVTEATFVLHGGSGAGNPQDFRGGYGAEVTAAASLTPGDTLGIVISRGADRRSGGSLAGEGGGALGGTSQGYGGGGLSAVLDGDGGEELLVAGGGGGQGGGLGELSGSGGDAGEVAGDGADVGGAQGGAGATEVADGAGGSSSLRSFVESLCGATLRAGGDGRGGFGGPGGTSDCAGGGGGGAGFRGGGGGGAGGPDQYQGAGGGAGTSFAADGLEATIGTRVEHGGGQVVISFTVPETA
ncbi:PE-PGRS family protein [Georgenia muralis]